MHIASPIRLAVITGQHPFDVIAFQGLLRRLGGLDVYVQDLDNWAAAEGDPHYDALLFYSMHRQPPTEAQERALSRLGRTSQGIVILHHAALAFPGWDGWAPVVGIADRRFRFHPDQDVPVDIVEPAHPITHGLAPWTMPDETYQLEEPDADSRVLLATDHPRSLRALLWTRQLGKARVVVTACGHGPATYRHPAFQTILARSLRWAAGA